MSSKGIKIDTFPAKDGECFIGYQSFAYVPATGITTLTINKPWKLDLTNESAQTNTAFGDGYSDVKKLIVHSEFSDLDEASIWRLVFGREMVEGINEIEILEG